MARDRRILIITYQVVEHFPHKVSQQGVILPLLDVGFEEVFIVLVSQCGEYRGVDVLAESLFVVIVQRPSLVELIADLEDDTIESSGN